MHFSVVLITIGIYSSVKAILDIHNMILELRVYISLDCSCFQVSTIAVLVLARIW